MKPLLLLSVLACSAVVAFGQSNRPDWSHVTIRAEQQENDGPLIRCRGNVEVATGTTLLRADEVDFHTDTGEIEARGNVRLQLAPGPPKANVSRPAESTRPDTLPAWMRRRSYPLTLPEIIHPEN